MPKRSRSAPRRLKCRPAMDDLISPEIRPLAPRRGSLFSLGVSTGQNRVIVSCRFKITRHTCDQAALSARSL